MGGVMTKLRLHVKVKFRAFGVTFGTVEKIAERVIPVALAGVGHTLIHINERGVFIDLTQELVTVDGE